MGSEGVAEYRIITVRPLKKKQFFEIRTLIYQQEGRMGYIWH